MIDLKEAVSSEETSVKQLIFFYELCKMGVVRFNLNVASEVEMLKDIVKQVASFNEADYLDKSLATQHSIKLRHQIHCLIIWQLLNHVIPFNNRQ